jgi:hypothetical protein
VEDVLAEHEMLLSSLSLHVTSGSVVRTGGGEIEAMRQGDAYSRWGRARNDLPFSCPAAPAPILTAHTHDNRPALSQLLAAGREEAHKHSIGDRVVRQHHMIYIYLTSAC